MTKRMIVLALLVAFICVDAQAQNHTYRRRGALLGGLAGAAIGVAIGDKGNNETAGALIGGAVGAVAGGTIGNQKDQRINHNYRYHSGQPVYPQSGYQYGAPPQYGQPYYSPQLNAYPRSAPIVAPAVPVSQAVSPDEVIAMVRSGMSDSMIIKLIQRRGVTHELSVREVIQMHEMGVSETIITEMQVVTQGAAPEEVTLRTMESYRLPPPPTQPYGPSVIGPDNKK